MIVNSQGLTKAGRVETSQILDVLYMYSTVCRATATTEYKFWWPPIFVGT